MSNRVQANGRNREPLEQFRIVTADRFDDVLAIQTSRCGVYRVYSPDRVEACQFHLNSVWLAGMRLAFISYGRAAHADAYGTSSIVVTWNTQGHGRVTTLGREMAISADRGALGLPGEACSFDYAEDSARIIFGLSSGVLERHLAAITGVSPRGSVVLHPEFDMSIGSGAALKRFVRFVVAELDSTDAIFTNPGAAAGLRDAVVSMILHHHPHSHSRQFNVDARTALPAVVRRSEEYLATQASEAVSMTDLPSIVGVGLRSIQATFKKHRGYSPQEFLKTVRLNEAQAQLRSGQPLRVIDVAYGCGFAKLSSFSADYAKRFGELPSVTLRRARGNSGN
jgi:AraC-like DNA-binding protein